MCKCNIVIVYMCVFIYSLNKKVNIYWSLDMKALNRYF